MHIYSTKSKHKLSTCHIDIQKVFNKVIEDSIIDISVVYGLRTTKEQRRLYAQGRTAPGARITNCDGILKKSKHQESVLGEGSNAMDISIYCSENKYSSLTRYDPLHLAYIAGIVEVVSSDMLKSGEITHKFIWGGNWDRDGIIKFDQRLQDLCHWEITKEQFLMECELWKMTILLLL